MKLLITLAVASAVGLVAATVASQTIPDDPKHLPTKIGGSEKNTNSITVSGKVTLMGFPNEQSRPAIYVVAYNNGRLVNRRQVADNGSYSLNDIPRDSSTIVVEINHDEFESFQVLPGPASIVFKDFEINWEKYLSVKKSLGIVSVEYERSRENQSRYDRALSEIKKGNDDLAISLLKAVVTSDPKDYFALTHLGNAYFLKDDLKSAEDAYLAAISEHSGYSLASINLGKLYISRGEYDKAIEVLTKTVGSEPASADANRFLGEAYLAIKKGSKAVIYLNEAIRLAPIEMAEVHLRLAALYNAAGLKSRASEEYQKFLQKVPQYQRREELEKYIAENPPGK